MNEVPVIIKSEPIAVFFLTKEPLVSLELPSSSSLVEGDGVGEDVGESDRKYSSDILDSITGESDLRKYNSLDS